MRKRAHGTGSGVPADSSAHNLIAAPPATACRVPISSSLMKAWLIRTALALAANAAALIVAAILLDGFQLGLSFPIALVIFSLASLGLKALARAMYKKHAAIIAFVATLPAIWLSLLITNAASLGISLSGFVAWTVGSVIVWLGTGLYDFIEDKVVTRASAKSSS